MNWPLANSDPPRRAGSPPPFSEGFVLLPDGSCIPATPKNLKIVLRQMRSYMTNQRRIKAKEKAVELQCALEDRAAARRLLEELAEIDRERLRIAATLRYRVQPDAPQRQTSDVIKRVVVPIRKPISMTPVASSWVVDGAAMRGVHYAQSYIGRSTPGFYRGAARDRWEYEARDEAVVLDAEGNPVIVTNLGVDIGEIGAGWQAIEDATTRKNGKIQIRVIVALDADASETEKVVALEHFCDTVLAPLGLPYSAVIHRAPKGGDARNVHAHILTNFRPTKRVAPYTWEFADHVRGELDGRDGLQMLRHLWAHAMSEAAERAGRNMLYTGLGYGARGLGLETGEHLGEASSAMLARGAIVLAHERNQVKARRNALRRSILDADRKIDALTTLRDAVAQTIDALAGHSESAPLMPTPLMSSRSVSAPEARRVAAPVVSEASLQPFVRSEPVSQPAPLTAAPQPQSQPVVIEQSAPVAVPLSLVAFKLNEQVGQLSPGPRPHVPTAPLEPSSPATAPQSCVASSTIERAVFLTVPGVQIPEIATVSNARSMLAAIRAATEAQSGISRMLEPSPRKDSAKDQPERLSHPAAVDQQSRATAVAMPPLRRVPRRKPPIMRPSLDQIATREWLEQHPMNAFDERAAREIAHDEALIERVRRADAYVGAFEGACLLDPRTTEALKVKDEWVDQAHVQRGLHAIRADQHQAIAALDKAARARPLAFSAVARRFWPNDLAPDVKGRVDRWSRDEMFGADVVGIERVVRGAHARDAAERRAQEAVRAPTPKVEPEAMKRRKGAPPADDRGLEGVKVRSFAGRSARPTRPLLMLIRYAGEHPERIALERTTFNVTDPNAPVIVRSLAQGWRDDPRVRALVSHTVNASKAAGRPMWPTELYSEMTAIVAEQPKARWSPRDIGLTRG